MGSTHSFVTQVDVVLPSPREKFCCTIVKENGCGALPHDDAQNFAALDHRQQVRIRSAIGQTTEVQGLFVVVAVDVRIGVIRQLLVDHTLPIMIIVETWIVKG